MPAWARLLVLLGLLALLSAQTRPAALLTRSVAAGHLDVICSSQGLAVAGAAAHDAGTRDEAPSRHAGAHCDLCLSTGWTFLPLSVCAIPSYAGEQVAAADFPAQACAAIPGLPFSRGPPSARNPVA